jgi:glycosyltransferase involved in cell wall biosynthesis
MNPIPEDSRDGPAPPEKSRTVADRPRVLFVAPSAAAFTGGPSANTANFSASRAFHRNDVVQVDIAPPPGQVSRPRRALHSIRLFGRLILAIQRHRPGAAYLMTGSHAGFYEKAIMGLVCRVFGAGTVLHLIGGEFRLFVESSPFHRTVVPWLLERTTIVACVGSSWMDLIRGIAPGARPRLLPNPVDASRFRNLPVTRARSRETRDVRFLFVGIHLALKGPLDLVEACARRREDLEERATFILAGSGPELATVRRLILDRGVDGFVQAPGFVSEDDKMRLLGDADAFVLPSHTEGFPVALLEAMAAGLPVIACPVGAVPDAVDDNCGMLVAPRDPDALGTALVAMVDAGARRLDMGRHAREVAWNRYDIGPVGDALDALWAEAVDPQGRRRK